MVQLGLQPVYNKFMNARMGLATAFRRRELHDKKAYEDAERCYQTCEETIEKAMQAREKAEQEALSTYREKVDKAVKEASEEYRASIRNALIECKRSVQSAWKASMETSASMTEGLQKHETIPMKQEQIEGNPHRVNAAGKVAQKVIEWERAFGFFLHRVFKGSGRTESGNKPQ